MHVVNFAHIVAHESGECDSVWASLMCSDGVCLNISHQINPFPRLLWRWLLIFHDIFDTQDV